MNSVILSGRLGSEIREYTTTNGKTLSIFHLPYARALRKTRMGTIPSITFKSKYVEL